MRQPWLVAAWLVLVGLLMICRLRTPAPKGLRVRRERARWLLVGVALVAGLGISRLWLLMILLTAAYLARSSPPPSPAAAGRPHQRPEADMRPEAVTASYRRWAPVYDRSFGAVTMTGRRRAVAQVNRRRGRVLEVGVGTGLALAHYAPHLEVTGIDFSAEMLAKAEAKVAALGLAQVVALRRMDARALDFPDASFDTVVAMHLVSVVPEPERVVAEMARVCRPGGEVLILNHFLHENGPARPPPAAPFAPLADQLGWHSDFPMSRVLGEPIARARRAGAEPAPRHVHPPPAAQAPRLTLYSAAVG